MFGSSFDWCDRECERCPLAPSCKLRQQEESDRAWHLARGEDPDELQLVVEDAELRTAQLLSMLNEQSSRTENDDPDPIEHEPFGEPDPELNRLAIALAKAVRLAIPLLDPRTPRAIKAELLRNARMIAQKCARIGHYLQPDADDLVWIEDGVPNLLLIEALRQRIAVLSRVERALHEGLGRMDAELGQRLAPLTARIPTEARVHLQCMIEQGQAPSPFCIVE